MRYELFSFKKMRNSVALAYILMLVLTILFMLFILPKEDNVNYIIDSMPDKKVLEIEVNQHCYEELMKTGNFIQGGEVYQIDDDYHFLLTYGNEKRLYRYKKNISNKYNDYIIEHLLYEIKNSIAYVDDYFISVSDKETLILQEDNEKNMIAGVNFEWRKKAFIGDNIDYQYIIDILYRQHTGKITIEELIILIGLTDQGYLLNYNGDFAVFTERTTQAGENFVRFIRCNNDGTVIESERFRYNKEVSIIAVDCTVCYTYGSQIHLIWLDDFFEKKINCFSEENVISVSYGSFLNKDLLFFNSDTKVCYVENFTNKDNGIKKIYSSLKYPNTKFYFIKFKDDKIYCTMFLKESRSAYHFTWNYNGG